MKQIGGDCAEFADKFKTMDEIFAFNSVFPCDDRP